MLTVTVENKLTDKQQRFVEEYTIDLNATQAAIRAGYAIKCAQQIGSENLSKPLIKAAINKVQQDLKQIMAGSREKSARDYEEARQLALRINQPAAAVSAIRWRDGLFGLQSLDNNKTDATVIIINPPKSVRSVESEVIENERE